MLLCSPPRPWAPLWTRPVGGPLLGMRVPWGELPGVPPHHHSQRLWAVQCGALALLLGGPPLLLLLMLLLLLLLCPPLLLLLLVQVWGWSWQGQPLPLLAMVVMGR